MSKLHGEAWVLSPQRKYRDMLLATAAIPIVAPLGTAAIGLSRLFDGPDPIASETRVGKNSKPQVVRKIRTSVEGQPTYLGRLFKNTAIDELPQILDIASGKMNLIGPRILPTSEIDSMSDALPQQVFDEWYRVYETGGPGYFSSLALESHASLSDDDAQPDYTVRVKCDISDFYSASPYNDLRLLSRAADTAIRLAKNIRADCC